MTVRGRRIPHNGPENVFSSLRLKAWESLILFLMLFTNPTVTAHSQTPGEYATDANTVLLMHMNETSGTTVSDVSKNKYTGHFHAGSLVEGRFGNGFMPGDSLGIEIPKFSTLDLGNQFTIETWINVGSLPGSDVKFIDLPNQQRMTLKPDLGLEVDIVSLAHYNQIWGQPSDLDLGKWHHVAVTFDKGLTRVFIDGCLKRWDTFSYPVHFNVGRAVIAGNPNSIKFPGLLDEVRISKIARDPVEFNLQLPPENLTAIAVGDSIRLDWLNGGGAAPWMRYRIYRGMDSLSVSLIDSTIHTSYADTKMTLGSPCFYRISAVDSTEFEGVKSNAAWAATRLPGEYGADENTMLLMHLNEEGGYMTCDASGHHNFGQSSRTTAVEGRFGKARQFDAQSRITVPHSASIDFNWTDFTIEGWIQKPPQNQHSIWIDKFSPGGRGWIVDFLSDGRMQTRFMDDFSHYLNLFSNQRIDDMKWHHVAVCRRGSQAFFTIDGVVDSALDISEVGDMTCHLPLLMEGGNHLSDEIRISNKARNPEEFNLRLPPKNLSATADGGRIRLAWQDGGGAAAHSHYRIFRGPDSLSVSIHDSTTGVSYEDARVTPGAPYFYRISAVDSTGFEGLQGNAGHAFTSVAGAYQPDTSTVLLLHLDEEGGHIAYDAGGFGNNGRVTNASVEEGRFERSRKFVSPGSISVAHAASLDIGDSEFSMEAWIRTAKPVQEWGLISNRLGSSTGFLWGVNGDGHPFFLVTSLSKKSKRLTGKETVDDLKWHHCAVTGRAGENAVLYVDGAPDDSLDLSGMGGFSSDYNLTLGAGTAPVQNGFVDEVRLSKRRRSTREFNLQIPPVHLTATADDSAIGLNWRNGGGATPLMIYRIYRGTDPPNVSLIDSTASTAYSDTGLTAGIRYFYRVSAVDSTGFEGAASDTSSAMVVKIISGITDQTIPTAFKLFQNYPNPFNPATGIRFALPEDRKVLLKIFNLHGQEIRRLADGAYRAGTHSVAWDGRDSRGIAASSGIYLVRIQAGEFTAVKKMSLMR